jgi:hypothetical protein
MASFKVINEAGPVGKTEGEEGVEFPLIYIYRYLGEAEPSRPGEGVAAIF